MKTPASFSFKQAQTNRPSMAELLYLPRPTLRKNGVSSATCARWKLSLVWRSGFRPWPMKPKRDKCGYVESEQRTIERRNRPSLGKDLF
jgi:hypothetical protein